MIRNVKKRILKKNILKKIDFVDNLLMNLYKDIMSPIFSEELFQSGLRTP